MSPETIPSWVSNNFLQASQADDVGALTDNSGGTSGAGTVALIDAAGINEAADRVDTQNAVATLAQEINDIRDALQAAGLMA